MAMNTQTTDNELITAPVPRGKGWKLDVVSDKVVGPACITMFRLMRDSPGEMYMLLAKDYTIPVSVTKSAEDLVTKQYPDSYRAACESVTYQSTGPVTINGQVWWQANFTLTLKDAEKTVLEKVERVCCIGDHVLVLSYEGKPKDVMRWKVYTEDWIAGVSFKTLNDSRITGA
jgi:hypothetical protein